MAGLDPSIYAQLAPPQPVQNPLALLAQATQIQSAQAQMERASQANARENRLLQLVQDPSFAQLPAEQQAQKLYGVGAFEQGGQVITNSAKARADNRAAAKTDVEIGGKIQQLMGGPLKALADNPTAENAAATFQTLASLKIMSPEQIQSAMTQVQQNPTPEGIKAFAMRGYQAAIDADKQMPKIQTSNTGGATTTQVFNPVTGLPMASSSVANTQSPDNAASVAATKANTQARIDDTRATREFQVEQKRLAQEQKQTAELDKKVTSFSTQLEKTNIPQFENLLTDIEAEIGKYAKTDAEGKTSYDLPGFGATGSVPQFLLSEQGKALRQKIATLSNLTLKDRSGAAVTNQELQRLLNELGTGVLSKDADLVRGLQNTRNNFNSVKRNVVAGAGDDVIGEYVNRGGINLERGERKVDAGGKPATPDLSSLEAELKRRGLLK